MRTTDSAGLVCISREVPIWTRSDAAIHLVPQLRRREAVPGIVGQNKYWEVYKARSYSSLNDVAAWQSRYKAIILRSCAEMGVCTADLVSVEWYAAVWGRTIASIAALVVVFSDGTTLKFISRNDELMRLNVFQQVFRNYQPNVAESLLKLITIMQKSMKF